MKTNQLTRGGYTVYKYTAREVFSAWFADEHTARAEVLSLRKAGLFSYVEMVANYTTEMAD